MRILITGASGFIGRNLIDVFLASPKNFEAVYAITRQIPEGITSPSLEWIQADLREPGWVKKIPEVSVDCVIHLAQSKHYRDFPKQASDIFDINVKATVELAEWSWIKNVPRFLFASSGNVYGKKNNFNRNTDCCNPETMYAASKFAAETLLRPFSVFMNVQILRFFGVYGPGQENAMVSNIVKKFFFDEEIFLASDIGVKFNPIYVDDCVSAICSMLNKKPSNGFDVINVGGEEVVTLRTLVSILESQTGKNARVRIKQDLPTILLGYIQDESVLQSLKVNFETGVQRILSSAHLDLREKTTSQSPFSSFLESSQIRNDASSKEIS